MSEDNNDDHDQQEKKIVPDGKFHSDSDKNVNNELNNNSKPDKQKKSIFNAFGPGIVTGASDDDPSGIATYSQAGAKFGLGLLWMAIFQFPIIVAIQEMCARIGLITGKGLADLIQQHYSKRYLYPIVVMLLIANTINIGADIGAMAAAVRLIIPELPILFASLLFTIFILVAEVLIPYNKYVRILKYLSLTLFAYVITAIIVGGNWNQIFFASVVPHFELNSEFIMMFVAMLGTTISPYLFFWQTSEEAEEDVAKNKIKEIGKGEPKITNSDIKTMKADVSIGMFFSLFIAWSIIVTSSGSLHLNGVTNIQSADQAAHALEPVVKSFPNSGYIAKFIFALGIIGTGLLAVPVLAGASAYALSDTFGWKEGLGKKFRQAKQFYAVIIASTIVGIWINFAGIDPIQALIYAAVINGVVSVPIIFTIMKIANDKKILHDRTNGLFSNIIGWFAFALMGFSVVIMFLTWLTK